MHFWTVFAVVLAITPAVLAQTDGNWQCFFGHEDSYPEDTIPDKQSSKDLRRCFKKLRNRWEPGARCRNWWISSGGHRWKNPHHCWKACYKCMDSAINHRQAEAYCDKYKVTARCVMRYKPWVFTHEDGSLRTVDSSTLGLPGNSTSPEDFTDLYDPAWDEEDDDMEWDSEDEEDDVDWNLMTTEYA